LAPISDCNCGDERLWHRVAPMPSGPNCGQASRPKWLATSTLIAGQFIRGSKDRPARNPSADWGPHKRGNVNAGLVKPAGGRCRAGGGPRREPDNGSSARFTENRCCRSDSGSSRRGNEADFAIKPDPPRHLGGYGVRTDS